MYDDFDLCRRAVRSKDPRFDGWFLTCVISTGIYCRASCPVVPPRRRARFAGVEPPGRPGGPGDAADR